MFDLILECSYAGQFLEDFTDKVIDSANIFSLIMDFYKPPIINVLLVGGSGCGKSSLVKKLKKKQYNPLYISSAGINISTICRNIMTFRFIEIPGKFINKDINIENVDIIIYMYDETIVNKNIIIDWKKKFKNYEKPTLYVRNKNDIRFPELPNFPDLPDFPNMPNFQELQISVKNSQGIDEMLDKILQKMKYTD